MLESGAGAGAKRHEEGERACERSVCAKMCQIPFPLSRVTSVGRGSFIG